MKQWQLYDGRIAQEVVDVYDGSESPTKRRKNIRNCGCCEAVLIDSRDEEGATGSSDNRKRTSSEKNDSSAANNIREGKFLVSKFFFGIIPNIKYLFICR